MPSVRASFHLRILLLALVCSLFGAAVPPITLFAAAQDNTLRVEPITAYNFVVDSNVESPSTYAPRSASIGAKFCNDGTNDMTDVFAYIGTYDANPANRKPGIYPSRTHPGLTGPLPGGAFALTHEGGSAGLNDATRYISRIPAGKCITQYWLVSYPRLDTTGQSVTLGIKPDDDLWLQYDIWGSANDAGVTRNVNVTRRATMRNEISAMANKIWPNGDNKVPDVYKQAIADALGWDTLTPGGGGLAYPGEVVRTQGVWYDFGNVGAGFDNNSDYLPDHNAWVQPIGDPGSYDPGCFRLVRTYGLVIVKLVGGGEKLIPFEDQLYFENIPDNTGAVGLVYYAYAALDGACTAGLSPYQEVASGFDNEKFNADFGVGIPPLQSQQPAVTLNKTANPVSMTLPNNIAYTLAFANTGPRAAGNPAYSVPLVLRDNIPAGTTYVTGSATANNTLPSGITARVLFSNDNGSTWSTTEPAANTVTNIQWWLSDALPAGASGSVKFSVNVPTTYAQPQPVVPNTGEIGFGTAAPFAKSKATTLILGNNSLSGNVFRDNGATGGTLGNTIKDGGETNLANVTVSLYYDANNDGVGDTLINTAVSDANGNYTFGNLPDGYYVVVVDDRDSDIPTGYAPTTPTSRRAALDPGKTTASTVTQTGLDVAFAPALSIDKRLDTTGTVYEGDNVQYTLTLNNNLPGNGTAGGNACTYTVWSTHVNTGTEVPSSGTGNAAWQAASNALNKPDGTVAYTVMTNNSNVLGLSGFNLGNMGGNITSVKYRVHTSERTNLQAGDQLTVDVYRNDASVKTDSYTGSYFSNPVGTSYTIEGTVAGTWNWNDFGNNLTEMRLTANKGSGNGSGDINLDAAAFVITTDQTCNVNQGAILNPIPLNDTFDSTKLQFVSATPQPDSVGTGTLSWNNMGPLYAGQTKQVVVTFKAKDVGTNMTTTNNTATTSNVKFADGRPANTPSDVEPVSITPAGAIEGYVWSDLGTTGWVAPNGYDASDGLMSNVKVTLLACRNTSTGALLTPGTVPNPGQPCSGNQNAGTFQAIATQTTVNGYYKFDGLRNGFYIVQVTAPSGTQTAEANDNQTAGGQTCGTCDNTWGNTGAPLSTTNFNPIDTANEAITNVNFGYNINPTIYGTVWQDYNADGARATNDTGLGNGTTSVKVTLRDCGANTTCGDNDDSLTPTFTDANGNYQFNTGILTNRRYQITTDVTTLPSGSTWTETAETAGTESLINNLIQIDSFPTGKKLSGSHDFGFHRSGSSSIGDTLYYDWNGNGTQDAGDTGIANVTIKLYEDLNNNGVIDGNEPMVGTQTTNASGQYLFSNLAAGNDIVKVDTSDSDFPAAKLRQTQDPNETGACVTCDNQSGSVNVTGTNSNLAQDFGYRPVGGGSIGDTVWKDVNGNQVQGGAQEIGIANVSVMLQADLAGNGVLVSVPASLEDGGDGATDATGLYRYRNLPDGVYTVTVDKNDPDIPDDPFGNNFALSTPQSVNRTITNGNTDLTADFGFYQLGAIGDTIFWDANHNGQQDWNETGINGVTVRLYNDVNTNKVYDSGTDTLVATKVTSTDVKSNAAGKYLFTALPIGNYVVVVDTTTIPGGAPLTSDPESDGVPCPNSVVNGCNSQTKAAVLPGTNYMGADFGYQPLGVIGDTVWIDANADGVRDATEQGIPFVKVELVNGSCTPNVNCPSTETDDDGLYMFSNVADGTYTVKVYTNDPDFPTGLSQTFDKDATFDSQTTVVVTGGQVQSIGGAACTNCGLNVDFAYRYAGARSLSGTICVDNPISNGVCGPGATGVDANESAFSNQTVFLYRWTDSNNNSVIDGGETTAIANTLTNAQGDYTFANIPAGVYISSLAAPANDLSLTTALGNTPATRIVKTPTTGAVSTAYQVVTVPAATSVTNVDFAFKLLGTYDFGDLPSVYQTTLGANPVGPYHTVSSNPSLYLGSNPPDVESNGQPSATANGDGADEDGVTMVNPPRWTNGTNGGAVQIKVTGSGWLTGWIDFNGDGHFGDAGEFIINKAVSTSTNTYTFNIPSGTIGGTTKTLNMRFRLFEGQPLFPALAYSGPATGGEVEDYQVLLTPTAVTMVTFTTTPQNNQVTLQWETATELDTAGFHILRSTTGKRADAQRVTANLIPAQGDGARGATYRWEDTDVKPGITYTYWLQEVETDGSTTEYGPATPLQPRVFVPMVR